MMYKLFLQRLILVMLLSATSLVSFARFDSEYGHSDHTSVFDTIGHSVLHAPGDLLTESAEEGLEEEVDAHEELTAACFCKNAQRWVDHNLSNYSPEFSAFTASDRCVILSVFRL